MNDDFKMLVFGQFQVAGFDTVLNDGTYHLDIILLAYDEKLEMTDMRVISTEVVATTLIEMATKVLKIQSSGLFDGLGIIPLGHIISQNGEIIETVTWEDIKEEV